MAALSMGTSNSIVRTLGFVAFATGASTCSSPPPAQWEAAAQNLPGALLDIWARGPNDVYSVGSDTRDGKGPLVVHFDGTQWQRLLTGRTSGDLWWIASAGTSTFVVGTGGTILQADLTAATFTPMTTPSSAPTLFGVWGMTPSDVWAVGGDPMTMAAALWHFDGSTWSDDTAMLPSAMVSNNRLFKVWGRAANDAWAVGEGGVSFHWDGSSWTPISTGSHVKFTTVHGNATTQIAVGGYGSATIIEGSGTTWTTQSVNFAQANGVFVPDTGEAVAVGNSGMVARRTPTGWVEDAMEPSTSLDFHSVSIDSNGNIWTVGGQIATSPLGQGMIWHWGTGNYGNGTVSGL